MAQLYSFFQNDSEEVQHEWLKFTQKVCLAKLVYTVASLHKSLWLLKLKSTHICMCRTLRQCLAKIDFCCCC